MAALMKKRVLAEFNQSQTVTAEPPVKRLKTLRLPASASKNGSSNKGSSALAYCECLEKCKGGNDALQLLVRISDTLGQMAIEDIPTAVKKLSERFAIEQEAAVRAKILWIFAELGELTYDPLEKTRIVNETANLLKEEKSHRVKSQGLATLLKLGDYNKTLVLKIARDHLPDTWHGVQTRCLSIIGRYLSANAADDTLVLVNNYAKSQDPRVRAQAFETMAELHTHRSCRLPASFFQEACQCLRDDYEIVRRAVLKLIWLLGNEYPETMISGGKDYVEDMRMVDSAFCKLCSLMGDLSPRVRASAMALLGSLKGVSRRHIEQALDKKQIRVEDEGPRDEERTGINTCGAFIHGLEDEFLEVRTAAVESLCALSLERPVIARISLEFMVDMFNDEIQDVRIRAIESLRKMSASVTLSKDQLETILGALEDFSGEVREGLHATLGASRVATKICLHMCVTRLLDNLSRYPQDQDSIYNCLATMGASHPYLTLPLVPQLLGQHPFFDTPELNVALPAYVSVLVLIFNAAAHCPSMHSLFTHHAVKHYHYLRDTMPHLVPRLKPTLMISTSRPDEKIRDEETEDENARKFLEKMVSAVELARPGGRVYRQLLDASAIDLDRLAEMDLRMEGVARFLALYIRCLLLLNSVIKEFTVSPSTSTTNSSSNITNKITQLYKHSQQLLRLFIGLGDNEMALANDIWLKALALDLIRVASSDTGSALPLARQFLAETDTLPQDASKLPPFSKALVHQLPAVGEAKPGTLAKLLLPLLVNPPLKGEEKLPRPPPTTKYCQAIIEEPISDSDTVLKFTGGLILGIPLTAKILNLRDPSAVRIKLRHPDQKVQLLLPRKSDLKLQNSDKTSDYRLRTTVLLSHQVWMEACFVDISIALLVPSAQPCTHPPLDDPCVLDLCKPTKIAIAPKQVKRGI
ncbi:integrator complex subunit 4 [Nasonia vitripennis]|uniref:Integrator complex subunit 4 n=1 Tax=Nasonia vitripennis TaxID=7425 RepID=A0A7M7T6W4_NASVI|nr:integrator complex subunit 4 [Nasonia vitripennis]XP_031778633.1 integrator complex subunit 4 [Nasonia vitripennis]XP_031778634.1 integrator complex subunit 4 [Nasonia vitripennis]XP_031778635.1 integrator complex subunit 4 [Nasonia vitripennis]XP_031778636.1 integrator complex subunit 4 [Nasonia vitripennis]XP_032453573.1 integrator complex subunit 4 [Nasonia vitripennis]